MSLQDRVDAMRAGPGALVAASATTATVIAPGHCGYCERQRDDLVTCADGMPICLDCRRKEQLRYAALTAGQCNRCPYHMDWHGKAGECPSENQARAMSGDR